MSAPRHIFGPQATHIATLLPRSSFDAQRFGYSVTTCGLLLALADDVDILVLLDPSHEIFDPHDLTASCKSCGDVERGVAKQYSHLQEARHSFRTSTLYSGPRTATEAKFRISNREASLISGTN